jgi:MarR family transcriptional regulator, organic hydroperoxide resistance regulator
MENTARPDEQMVEQIASNIFHVMPLLRKRLLRLDVVQAEHGIPLSHAQVLAMLSENKSMSVSEISRKLGIAKPNITPLVDRLIASDLVDRVRDTGDRRVVNVVIQPAGIQKLAEIQKSIGNQVREWANNMSEEDFNELATALNSITRILSSLKA